MAIERRLEVCFVLRQLLKLCADSCVSTGSVPGGGGGGSSSLAYRPIEDESVSFSGNIGNFSSSSSSISSSISSMCPVIARLLVDAWREVDLDFAGAGHADDCACCGNGVYVHMQFLAVVMIVLVVVVPIVIILTRNCLLSNSYSKLRVFDTVCR